MDNEELEVTPETKEEFDLESIIAEFGTSAEEKPAQAEEPVENEQAVENVEASAEAVEE